MCDFKAINNQSHACNTSLGLFRKASTNSQKEKKYTTHVTQYTSKGIFSSYTVKFAHHFKKNALNPVVEKFNRNTICARPRHIKGKTYGPHNILDLKHWTGYKRIKKNMQRRDNKDYNLPMSFSFDTQKTTKTASLVPVKPAKNNSC